MEKTKISFEDSIKRIEEIVNILENGDTTLEQSLSLFEEAAGLCKECNCALENARKKLDKYTLVTGEEK